MGGPWYIRRYIYEGIQQIGQDSFIILFIAKFSPLIWKKNLAIRNEILNKCRAGRKVLGD